MLSEAEKRKILDIIASAERNREAALDALKVVQENRGWVSEEIKEIADLLGLTPVELESLATFYDGIYRRPVGKHVITICDSASCWITGCVDLIDHLLSSLGVKFAQTTADGLFTVLPAACLGVCEMAPAMMVDDKVYGNLTPEKIDRILEQYR